MTSWRSASGEWKLLDGDLYRKVAVKGKAVWVYVSYAPTYLESVLLKLLQEAASNAKG